MEAVKETITEAHKEEVKESREVRRMRERINEDAHKTFVALADKYRQFFMDNNANGEDVQEFKKQVCAKWRVYCKNRNLIPEAFTQMDKFCADLMAEYIAEYKAQDEPIEPIRYRRDLYKIIDLSLPAAEVGVAEGYFSADILSWGVKHLYMIDNWATLNQAGDGANNQVWHDKNKRSAQVRVFPYKDKTMMLQGLSVDMARWIPDDSLGFINIDCDHSYSGVSGDIQAYWPKVKSGGVIAFHDYENKAYGVKRAVEEFAAKYSLTINLLPEDKPEDAGAYIVKP